VTPFNTGVETSERADRAEEPQDVARQ